jgi:hypothetical protein
MKFKPTLVAVAVLALAGSVQAQTPPAQTYLDPNGKRYASIEEYQIQNVLSRVGVTRDIVDGKVQPLLPGQKFGGAWSRGFTGKGVDIVVIDNGFDLGTYDLKVSPNNYKNFYPGQLSAANIGWGEHGTAMSSIAAGKYGNGVGTVGVAYDATLLLAQAGQGGRMPQINDVAVVSALNWAEDKKAAVVNMSFSSTYDLNFNAGTKQISPGVYQYQGPLPYGTMYGKSSTFALYQTSKNTTSVVVAAAGNGDVKQVGQPYAAFPGAFATATKTTATGQQELVFGGRWLIVGAVDANNNIASYSNRAGSICTNVVAGVCKDLYSVKDFYVVAPGGSRELKADFVAVAYDKSSADEYQAGNIGYGTSQAAAIVSGGIALIKQAWPQLKAAEIVQLVKTTATDLGKPGVDEVYGHGMVNFDKATQPYADVKYSKVALKSGTTVAGTTLTTTGATLSSSALTTSSVLSNVQVVDGINRNFTANFTKALGVSSPANSLFTSPYLAMNAIGYREFATPYNKDTTMTFMQSQNGFATQVDTAYGEGRLQVQFGAMAEQNGFLNNKGSGLLGMGNSGTTYAMVGGSTPITSSVDLIGSYGLGFTKTSNAQDSMLALSPTVISDTWKVGLAKKDIFFSGKTKDQVTFAVQGPVGVRKGYADVTAVTGYTYSGSEDDVTANPVITTERVNLASGKRQTDLVLGYNVSVGNTTYAGINFAKQFNVGGVSGQTGTAVGVMVRSVF